VSIEIRAAREEERPAIAHMIDVAFDAESYGPGLDNPCQHVGHSDLDPYDRSENTRILLVDGQLASVVHVAERRAYASDDVVPFGFIAMVATHPQHRRKGYAGLLLRDAEEYMRSRGDCYSVMLGAYRFYCGSLEWRWHAEKQRTLPQRYVVLCDSFRRSDLSARLATERDIPCLSRSYEHRYARSFGPVVRSADYWRLWSLACDWEGRYVLVLDGQETVGYFHASPGHDTVDEIGWTASSEQRRSQVFMAALAWGRENGKDRVGFCLSTDDVAGLRALQDAALTVTPERCRPDGQSTHIADVTPFVPVNWPDGVGILVKHLQGGPGLLADVRTTDDLTETMARHSWTWFDGDTM
jgi:GNAT superfamily N-acetyltransferase